MNILRFAVGVLPLVFGKSPCQYADTDALYPFEDIHAGGEGGSGGTNVVNQKDVLVPEQAFIFQLKHIADVFLPFVTAKLCLALHELFAFDGFGDDGQACYLSDATCQPLALVVSPLA